MLTKLRNLSKTQVITYCLFIASLLILSATAFLAFANIDVLTKWELRLPNDGKNIHAGDRVIVQSIYTKIRSADGEAIRYLDCKNKDGVILRYELNRRRANRAAKAGGTGIDVTMRTDVPDLPAKCRIAVAISYDTFIPWYQYPENNETKEFILLPRETASVSSESSESQKTSQTLPQATGQSVAPKVSGSSSNTTPVAETIPQDTSQSTLQSEQPNTNPAPAPVNPLVTLPIVGPILDIFL